jgi:hypothetical protein
VNPVEKLIKRLRGEDVHRITWRPEHENLQETGFEPPRPASKYVPDWYKGIPTVAHGRLPFNPEMQEYNHTVKNCVPIIDAFTTGFIQGLNCDLQVQRDIRGEGATINWPRQFPWEPVRPPRDPSAMEGFVSPEGFYKNPYLWIQPFEFGVPKGWSVLITHPLNRFDLPFRTMSAIVDSDSFPLRSEITFYLKSDFQGVIPKGTPIFQIIPIKRTNWESSLIPYNEAHRTKYVAMTRDVWGGAYRNRFWKKKSYVEAEQPRCPVMHGADGTNER